MSSPEPQPAVTVNIHGVIAPSATLLHSDGPFVSLAISPAPAAVNVFLCTPEEADALIRAAITAKDILVAAALSEGGQS